ncbi:MAG: hypothetical protein GX321_05050 [Clostridiales bacterium]|nr:hypothetical protein [Clostridiales bacterium]
MKKILATISLLLILSLSINVFYFIHNNNKEDNIKQNYDNYLELVEKVKTKFSMSGYTELLRDKNFFLALPMNATETDLIGRQKMFIYKNATKNSIILMSISTSKYNDTETNEWTSSYSYEPDYFNKKEGEYKEYYSSDYPKVQIATNGFNYNGCHISMLSFSNDNFIEGEDTYIAATELIAFSNELLILLKQN